MFRSRRGNCSAEPAGGVEEAALDPPPAGWPLPARPAADGRFPARPSKATALTNQAFVGPYHQGALDALQTATTTAMTMLALCAFHACHISQVSPACCGSA